MRHLSRMVMRLTWTKGLVTQAISCAISCPICCKSQMRFAVSAIWCRIRNCYRLHIACDMVLRYGVAICFAICCAIWCAISSCERQTRTRNRTPNRRYTKSHLRFGAKKKIGSDSCWTPNCRCPKSHMRFAANRTH
jgi:hypothetical protein